jgi:hypothetical protein
MSGGELRLDVIMLAIRVCHMEAHPNDAVKSSKSSSRGGKPVRTRAVSNVIAAVLLVIGIVVGFGIYYGIAGSPSSTKIAGSTTTTSTVYLPTTYVSTTTVAGTVTPSVSTTTITTTLTRGVSTTTITTTVTPGTTTGTASVALGEATCSIIQNLCTMEAVNGGTAAGSVTACQIGSLVAKTPSSAEVTVIGAGSTIVLMCVFSSMPQGAARGLTVSGTITVNDNLVSWTGTYVS